MKEKVRWKKKSQFSSFTLQLENRKQAHTPKKNWPLRTSVEDKEIGSESLTEILPTSYNPSIQIQCVQLCMSLKIGGGELQSFHLVVLYSSVGKEISQLVHALLMINLVGHITMYSLLNSRIFVCILFFPLQLNPEK